MAIYRYRAVNEAGRVKKGRMDAADNLEIIKSLRIEGLFPIEVVAEKEFRRGGRLSAADLSLILRGLGDQFRSGVPLDRALKSIMELLRAAKGEKIRELLTAVRTGRSLSEAMTEGGWPAFVISSVRAGETSGSLDQVLVKLADHYDQVVAFRSDLGLALAYPALILGVGVLSLIFMIAFVLPRLIGIFEGYEDQLPLLTQVFVALAFFLKSNWLPVIGVILSLVGGGVLFFITSRGKEWFDDLSWGMPLISSVVRAREWGRFGRTMALLLTNGVPALAALDLAREGARMRPVREMVERLYVGLRSGEKLSDLLREERGVPEMVRQMVSMGEESGFLGQAFDRMADFYDRRVRDLIRRTVTLAEPVLILILAVLIGLMVIAVILGIYSIMEVSL